MTSNGVCIGQSYSVQYDPNGNTIKKSSLGQAANLQVTGQETICSGDTLQWTASGGQTYQWSTGATTPTLQIVPFSSGQYAVTATAANGCTAVKSRSVTVLPKLALGYIQQVSPQGTTGPIIYTTISLPDATYYWTATAGIILSGQGTSSVQVQWNAGSQEQLTVYAVSQPGCRSDTLTFTPAGEDQQFVPLNQGWNLVSTYLAPFDYSATAVFADLEQAGVLERVKTIDKLYTPGVPPAINSLQQIADGAGYWMRVNHPATWQVSGLKLNPVSTPISLAAGWNLIGYLPNHPLPVQEALASVWPQVTFVKNIFASFDPAAPPILNTLQRMEPGHGYWVKVNAPATLLYPADQLWNPDNESRTIARVGESWRQRITAYPNSTAAYGVVTLHGQPVQAGQLILATIGKELRAVGETVLHEDGQSYVTLVLNGIEPEQTAFHLLQGEEMLTSSFQLLTSPGVNLSDYLPLAFGSTTGTAKEGYTSTLFPNPSTGKCTLRLNKQQATLVEISLTDLSGKKIWAISGTQLDQTDPSEWTLDFEPLQLPAGLYLVGIQLDQVRLHHYVCLQRP